MPQVADIPPKQPSSWHSAIERLLYARVDRRWSQTVIVHTFFTSAAHGDHDRDIVLRFHRDLEMTVKQLLGSNASGTLGLPMDTGVPWEQDLLEACRSARVLVALISDDYFESRWCRREWAIFLDRVRQATPPGGGAPPCILQVRWSPILKDLPNPFQGVQLPEWVLTGPHDLIASYRDKGLAFLMRNDKAAYQRLCDELGQLVARASMLNLPPLAPSDEGPAEERARQLVAGEPQRAAPPQLGHRRQDEIEGSTAVYAAVDIVVPALVRAASLSDDDLSELLRSVEALLGQARRFLDRDCGSFTAKTRRELEIACDSLAPQLLSTSPNLGAVAALFGQIVSVMAELQGESLTPEAAAVLADASKLGSEDPAVDGRHAQAIMQRVIDHAKDVIVADDPESSGLVADVVDRVRRGAGAGWSGALDDVERRAQRLVEGLPGVVANGMWLSAAAVASTAVQLAAADPRLTAGTGLVAVVLRFILATYTRRPKQPRKLVADEGSDRPSAKSS